MQISSVDFSFSPWVKHDLRGLTLATGKRILHQSVYHRKGRLLVHTHCNCLHNITTGDHTSPNEFQQAVQLVASCQRDFSDLDDVRPYPIQIRTFQEMTHAVMLCPLSDSMVCNIPQKLRENSKVFLKLFCSILIVFLIYDFYNTNMHDWDNAEFIGVRQNSLEPEGGAQSTKLSVQQRPRSSY